MPAPADAAARLLREALAQLDAAPDPASAARRHGIHAFLPDADRDELLRATARHAQMLANAVALSGLLRTHAIRHVVLKGPLLQELLYGDLGPRPCADLDLLVDASRAADAAAALGRHGWKSSRSRLLPHFHTVLRAGDAAAPTVELHRHAVDRANLFRVPDGELLDRAQEHPVPGGALPCLSSGDHFLYLCLHAAKHGFLNEYALAEGFAPSWFVDARSGNRLVWMLDIALLLEAAAADLAWETVQERVRRWNIDRPVGATLAWLARLLPSSRAAEASRALGLAAWQPARGGRLARRILQRAGTGPMHAALGWRPARLALVPDLLMPSNAELAGFLGLREVRWTDRAAHLWRMLRRLAAIGQ